MTSASEETESVQIARSSILSKTRYISNVAIFVLGEHVAFLGFIVEFSVVAS